MAGYEASEFLWEEELTFEIASRGDMRIELSFRILTAPGQIRFFSLSLWMESYAGRFELERVDTKHSELHRHRYYRDTDPERTSIRDLSPGDEQVVDEAFSVHYEYLLSNWDQILRRWMRGN